MLIATVLLPAEAVALEQTLDAYPDTRVEAERIAAHSTEWTMPCLWIDEETIDRETLERDTTVDRIVDLAPMDGVSFCHVEWVDEVETRINSYIDREGSILRAEATAGQWRLQLRFASREQFTHFRETVRDLGFSLELLDLTEPRAPRSTAAGLTPTQRHALVAAAERGYYTVPRQVTVRELADELDVSHQALSELLRRGTGQLIEVALTGGRDADPS